MSDLFQKKIRTGKVIVENRLFKVQSNAGSTFSFDSSEFSIFKTEDMERRLRRLYNSETPFLFTLNTERGRREEVTSILKFEEIEISDTVRGEVIKIDEINHYALVKPVGHGAVLLTCADVLFEPVDPARDDDVHHCIRLSKYSKVIIRFVKTQFDASGAVPHGNDTTPFVHCSKNWVYDVKHELLSGDLTYPFSNLVVCCQLFKPEGEKEKMRGKSSTLNPMIELQVDNNWQTPGMWFETVPEGGFFDSNRFKSYESRDIGEIFVCKKLLNLVTGKANKVDSWTGVYFVLIKLTETTAQEKKNEYVAWNDYFGEIPVEKDQMKEGWKAFDVLKGDVKWELSPELNVTKIKFKLDKLTLELVSENEAILNRCRFAQRLITRKFPKFYDTKLNNKLGDDVKTKYPKVNLQPQRDIVFDVEQNPDEPFFHLTFYFSRTYKETGKYKILSITKLELSNKGKGHKCVEHPYYWTTGCYIKPMIPVSGALLHLWKVEPSEGEIFGVFYSTKRNESDRHIDFYWNFEENEKPKRVTRSENVEIGQLGIMIGTDATTIRPYEINQDLLDNNTESHVKFKVDKRGKSQNPTIEVFGMIQGGSEETGLFAWAFPIGRVSIIGGNYTRFDIVKIQAEYDKDRGWIAESKPCSKILQTAEFLIHLERCNNPLFKEYCAEKQRRTIPNTYL